MTEGDDVSLETRIAGALDMILRIYNIPPETRKMKIGRVLGMDYRKIAARVLMEFKKFVNEANEQALEKLPAMVEELTDHMSHNAPLGELFIPTFNG